jgi:uncharacterized protein
MTKLKFNVAQLLREDIGSRREYDFTEENLSLDDTLVLRDIAGKVRFIRTATGVFVHIRAGGNVRLTCVRSLEEFDYHLDLAITDEFHSVIDVISGATLPRPAEEDPFLLDEFHMADIGECIREYTLLELPLNPVCEAWRDHPVSYTVPSSNEDEESEDDSIDQRLEVLKQWAQNHASDIGN